MKALKHYWPWGVMALALLAMVIGFLGLTQDPYYQDLMSRNLPPSPQHRFGTDSFGRDILARVVAGTGMTLTVAVSATAIALAGGAGLGLLGCIAGPAVRGVIYTGFDIIRTMPAILLSLALMVALGVGMGSVILAVGIAYMPLFAYVARAVYERETAAGYVSAARLIGASPLSIAWRHILPNAAGALLTQLAIVVPRAITTESVLSFFGLGVAPDVPTWGRILATAVDYAEQAPSSLLFPVLALSLTTLSLSAIGNRLRDRFDPLTRLQSSGT